MSALNDELERERNDISYRTKTRLSREELLAALHRERVSVISAAAVKEARDIRSSLGRRIR